MLLLWVLCLHGIELEYLGSYMCQSKDQLQSEAV